jgi:hypothetical protein
MNDPFPKMHVSEMKTFEEKRHRKSRQLANKNKKLLALLRKSEPATATKKIASKAARQNKIIEKVLERRNKSLANVRVRHREILENFGMYTEDRNNNTFDTFFDVYFQNYENWKKNLEMKTSDAILEDEQTAVLENKKQEHEKTFKLHQEHAKNMRPTLNELCQSSSSFCPVPLPYFTVKPKTQLQKVETLYANFYFEEVAIPVQKFINQFPELSVEGGDSIEANNGMITEESICTACEGELIRDEILGETVCPTCCVVKQGGQGLGFKTSFIESQSLNKGALPYDRRSHFDEFIQRLQGAERTEIPQAIIRTVLMQCKMFGINPVATPEKISYMFLRTTLRNNGYSTFFENIPHIRSIVTRKQPLTFSDDQKYRLQQIFQQIQAPFAKHKGNRKNFLSYSYVVYKSCELLEYYSFLPFLPLLKAPRNLHRADAIWAKICQECNFQFIPTAL